MDELREQYVRGKDTEERFIECCKSMYDNPTIIKATKEEDIHQHFDFIVNGDKIDVKARKNIGILNLKDNLYTVLELKNVNGDNGWLYGNADYIAFEIQHFFLVCPRLELVKYVEENLIDEVVIDINNSINKKFTRFGANDMMTTVPFSEIQTGAYIVKQKYCRCDEPKISYPEGVWCDICGLEIKNKYNGDN